MDSFDFSELIYSTSFALADLIVAGLHSNIAIAFFSSLAGAFGGAIAAQRVIERNKQKEVFLKELRNTNAAIMVSFSICNALLGLKRQHSQPLYEQYTKDRAKAKEIHSKLSAGEDLGTEPFHYLADLKTFSAPSVPIETLKSLVFNDISSHGRALSAVSFLEGAYDGLKEVLTRRESMILKFQDGTIGERETPHVYFGIQMHSGHINQEYSDLVEAMHSYINDVIFFSSKLCEDLAAYGNQLRKNNKRLAKNAPKVNAPDFSTPRGLELIPPDSDYSSWLNGFKESGEKD
ncbi:MAG: hypothetical protein ACQEXI_12425 [Pseudomonadota bacterium]